MAPPSFQAFGIARIRWEAAGATDGDRRDVLLTFLDSKGRPQKNALALGGCQISDWALQECVYDRCDQVRVLDASRLGSQVEFGRYTVQFVCGGSVVGEHLADTAAARRVG
jgi:hypothetical protein